MKGSRALVAFTLKVPELDRPVTPFFQSVSPRLVALWHRRWPTHHWNQTQAWSSLETSARLELGACVPPSSWFSPRMCHVRAPCFLPRAWLPATGHSFASFV